MNIYQGDITKRAIIALSVLALTALAANAAKPEKPTTPTTKLEELMLTKGAVIIKESQVIGKIEAYHGSSVEISVLTITKSNGRKIRGLKIEIDDQSSERSDSSLLDIDEVDGLISGIDYMIRRANEWNGKEKHYTEVLFKTRGDFQVGFYQRGTNQKGSSTIGQIYSAQVFLH